MIILTNDDGIDAPGLAALQRALENENPNARLVTVAPLYPMSECSHQVTTQAPMAIQKRGPHSYAVAGTPADCVRVALLHVLPELGVELPREKLWVYSGINAGGNLGADVYISGTVAAAREAAFFGIPAIAFSQLRRAVATDHTWSRATPHVPRVLAAIQNRPLKPGEFWNINFPWPTDANITPEIIFCERSRRPLPVKYEQVDAGLQYVANLYHTRDYEPNSDVDICFKGNVAISHITL
jgi:5'-nucleotidase